MKVTVFVNVFTALYQSQGAYYFSRGYSSEVKAIKAIRSPSMIKRYIQTLPVTIVDPRASN